MTLSEYLASEKLTCAEFASRLGVTDSAVSRWSRRRRCPGLALALKIAQATKGRVPVASWRPALNNQHPR